MDLDAVLFGESKPSCVKIVCKGLDFFVHWVTIFSLYSSISIAEIIIALDNRDEIECKSIINPDLWMLISGSVGLGIAFITSFFVTKLLRKNGIAYYFETITKNQHLFGLLMIIESPWYVVGSIIFWKDCQYDVPKPMHDLFWTILIFYWVCFAYYVPQLINKWSE